MAIASVELQKAIYTALKTGSYPVYEVVPPNTTMPYIVIGEEILTHNNTKTEIRTVHNITIHTWSKGSSSNESKSINDFVIKKLLAGFTVTGFYLDKISLEMMTTYKELDVDTIFHGVIQFEITITN
jgi:hypothetical protein